MSRLENKFTYLKSQNKAALVTYFMSYDPDAKSSLEILKGLSENGADIIELGMPFSDPMADGPIIQEAALRAFKNQVTSRGILDIVEEFRKVNNETPIILMGYLNPVLSYGADKFIADAKAAGVDGLLLVDLPYEEDKEISNWCKEQGMALIKLIAPTTSEERIQEITKNVSGFVYYVSVAGVTGTKDIAINKAEDKVKLIRKYSPVPIAVGFGIKTAEDVEQIAKFSDAVVVGSAIVKYIALGDMQGAFSFTKSLADKTKILLPSG